MAGAVKVGVLALVALAAGAAVAAEPVEVTVHTRAEWIELPPVAGNPTRAALRISRTVDPDSGAPHAPGAAALGFDPAALRRTFQPGIRCQPLRCRLQTNPRPR